MTEAIVQQHVAPVPNLTGVTKPQGADLTPTQQKHLDEVLAHFSKEDYELPVKEGDKKLAPLPLPKWLAQYKDVFSAEKALEVLAHMP